MAKLMVGVRCRRQGYIAWLRGKWCDLADPRLSIGEFYRDSAPGNDSEDELYRSRSPAGFRAHACVHGGGFAEEYPTNESVQPFITKP